MLISRREILARLAALLAVPVVGRLPSEPPAPSRPLTPPFDEETLRALNEEAETGWPRVYLNGVRVPDLAYAIDHATSEGGDCITVVGEDSADRPSITFGDEA